jgi:outer membrane protein assembly factor BamE (lipoprotein component of BamABCDE complex)
MLKKIVSVFVVLIALSSCVQNIYKHGYEGSVDAFQDLKKKKLNKVLVTNEVGFPSVVSTFNKNIWYYVSTKTKRVSFLKPQVIESRVIQVNFSKSGVVSDIKLYVIDKKRQIKFNSGKTIVKGDDAGLFKDFLYNFARFNKMNKKT